MLAARPRMIAWQRSALCGYMGWQLGISLVVTALTIATACTARGGARQSGGPAATVLADAVSCRAARVATSPIMWSCVIPAAGNPLIHGLSGLYYDASSSTLWAASDDGESYPADPARLIRFRLGPSPSLTRDGSLSLTRRGAPSQADGRPPLWQLEALAPMIVNGEWNTSFYVATENDALTPGLASEIYRCSAQGICEVALTLPHELNSRGGSLGGIQKNRGLEGLSTSPDGRRLFAALERALAQERPLAGERERVRILEYTLDGSTSAPRQYAYALDPPPANTGAEPGVSEIFALTADRLLALERSYSLTCGNTIRLFEVEIDAARVIAAGASVRQAVPLRKQLLIDFTDEKEAFDDPKLSSALDNFEGMTRGPDLADGSHTLLLVTDDNRRSDQITALVSLNLSSLPTAGARRWRDGDPPVCPKTQ